MGITTQLTHVSGLATLPQHDKKHRHQRAQSKNKKEKRRN